MTADELRTIARMERGLRREAWQQHIAGGFAAFVLFGVWLILAGLGVL